MNIKETIERVHNNAIEKGFWNDPREVGTLLMLCVSELAEALEADRKEKKASKKTVDEIIGSEGFHFDYTFETEIKDTFEDEIADTVIRIFDLCGGLGIDLEKHIELKMRYNKSREKLHGKKY